MCSGSASRAFAPLSPTSLPDLDAVVEDLCAPESLETVLHRSLHNTPMPSLDRLEELMSRLQAALFPGYFGMSGAHMESLRYHLSANLDSICRILAEQIRRGGCFACAASSAECTDREAISRDKAMRFMRRLPHIRRLLASDAKAAYEGDPAATSPGEAIFCYPSMLAMTHQRIAHELYRLQVPVIPRIITEMAHSRTGIDIHPGAEIGEEFFIDHGTGVVIGETTVIGERVKIYQGVTLGGLSTRAGQGLRGTRRHPAIGNDVTIYSNTSILGGETVIGEGCIIGGSCFITRSIPAHMRVTVQNPELRLQPDKRAIQELGGDYWVYEI